MDVKNISVEQNEITIFRSNGEADYLTRDDSSSQTWNLKDHQDQESVLSNAEVGTFLLGAVSNCTPGITFASQSPQAAEAAEQPAHHSGQYV